MRVVKGIKKMQGLALGIKAKGRSIGFVPTMGALHEGHLSLMRKARRENEVLAVSIFINPAQFSPGEDFKKYPRNLKRDLRLCRKEKVDIVFHPSAGEMFPKGYQTYVSVDALSDTLCAKFRPGHFTGVATVVTKLINILSPDIGYFGLKDAQQAVIIKKMAADLNMPVKIKVLPTVRETDGLALSSRNVYLNALERKDARVLYQSLRLAKGLIKKGVRDPSDIIRSMKELISAKKNVRIQYIAIVKADNLEPVKKISNNLLIALAAYIGKTRLIDNIYV